MAYDNNLICRINTISIVTYYVIKTDVTSVMVLTLSM